MSARNLRERIYLIGYCTNSLTGSKLPSNIEVLKVLFFNLRVVKKNLRESSDLVVKELFVFWEKARIPVKDKQHCITNVEKLYKEWQSFQKDSKKTSNFHKSKVNTWKEKLDMLFDVAHASALKIMSNQEDIDFLISQRKTGRPGFMYGIDYEEVRRECRLEERNNNLLQQVERNNREIALIACDLIDNGVTAIFGPSSKATSDIVEVICNATGIPHLQFDWHTRETERLRRNHQLTVNVAPSEQMLSLAFYDIMRADILKWNSFSIIYESSGSLGRLEHLFGWRNFNNKNGIKLWSFSRGDDYRIIWKHVSTTREKFVVLDCPTDIITEVMNASIYFNMTGPFNHWLLTNLDTHTSDLYDMQSDKFLAHMFAVRLRSYKPPSVNAEADFLETVEEDKINTIRSKLLYDAVMLYFNAVRHEYDNLKSSVSCHRGYWDRGFEFLDRMKKLTARNVTPSYKTQKMQLNEYGERDEFNLELYNPMTEHIEQIWNKKSRLIPYDSERRNLKMKNHKTKNEEDNKVRRVKYTVATRFGDPYFMWRTPPEGQHYEGNERFIGYAVELIYELSEQCGFDFVFEPVPDNKYGSEDPITHEWDGIIRQLIDQTAQIGICDLTITQARRKVVDFTVPFMQLGVSILFYKTPQPPHNLYGFLSPYSLDVWIYLIIAIFLTALALVMLGRISQSDWISPMEHGLDLGEEENIWNLSNSLWLNIGSILCQGCDLLPRSTALRLFTAFWWIFSLLVSQTYIAKLAAFITTSNMESSLQNLRDLVDQDKISFGMLKGGSTSLFFSESNESDYRLAWNKMVTAKPDAFVASNVEGVDRVKRSHGGYAFLLETTTLQYYLNRESDLMQIGSPFNEKHYGIALPLNSPFRTNISVGILKLSEKGKLLSLKNKWFSRNDTDQDFDSDESSQKQFTMESLGGLFIVLLGGILVSILIGIFEFLWNIEQISVQEMLPPTFVFKAELTFFLRFWLARKPLRTYVKSRGSTSTGSSSFDQTASTLTPKKKKKKAKKNHDQ